MRPPRRPTSTRWGGSLRTEDKSDLFSSGKTASGKRQAVGAIYCVLLARFAFRVSRANRLETRSEPIMGAVPLRGRPPRRARRGPCATRWTVRLSHRLRTSVDLWRESEPLLGTFAIRTSSGRIRRRDVARRCRFRKNFRTPLQFKLDVAKLTR